MKKIFYTIALLLQFGYAFAQQKKSYTNVILIIADDLGYADISCYGSTFYETPNLNKLATMGVKFTNNYASSPVCSPTRAAILTGKNPIQTGITDWIPGRQSTGKKPFEKLVTPPIKNQLAVTETTLAELALQQGYKTMLAGKWHLGEEEQFWPENNGFQINKGGFNAGSPKGRINDTTGAFFTPYKNPRLADGKSGEYLTDRLTNETIEFINANTQQPFFIMYSLYAVHNPLQAPTELVKKYTAKMQQPPYNVSNTFTKNEEWMQFQPDWKNRTIQNHPVYAAMIENMDTNIGRIMASLQQHGLDSNTLIILTSDNGGLSTAEGSPTTNFPLRAGKGWLYEGGIKVPLILYHPTVFSAGMVSNIPVLSTDVFSTMAHVIKNNFTPEKNVEGKNIVTLLKQKSNTTNSRSLFWYYPHYSNQGGKPSAAIRKGNYKLIYYFETNSAELFNVLTDEAEKNNIAHQQQAITTKLTTQLANWLVQNKAQLQIQ